MSTLVWFRQDLRVTDNPALHTALEMGMPVVPVFIFAPAEEGTWAPGGASQWWLHHSLALLDEELRRLGSRLVLRSGGSSLTELTALAEECAAKHVFWNRRYEPSAVLRDQHIKAQLAEAGLDPRSFNGALLHEPWEVKNRIGKPYQVFSAFWRHCLARPEPQLPLSRPSLVPAPAAWPESLDLRRLGLLPRIAWAQGISAAWRPGSVAAHISLRRFLKEAFGDYQTHRDRPDTCGTSRLSPHLHFGELSPREVWQAVRRVALQRGQHTSWRNSRFIAELGWREFAYHTIYHFPFMSEQPLNPRFANFPWKTDPASLCAWQRGATGFPIVDAGMRQLWKTGWMHNRVRMITASFLVKDLQLSWNAGARWFWDTLVDADLANNSLGWQWVAGCGADAAPYFRIFNPISQATKFDPSGAYVREWVPELAQLPREWIHQPWSAPPDALSEAKVQLGVSYPYPLVDHVQARLRAMAALASL